MKVHNDKAQILWMALWRMWISLMNAIYCDCSRINVTTLPFILDLLEWCRK